VRFRAGSGVIADTFPKRRRRPGAIRQFALGLRATGQQGLDGEAVAYSEYQIPFGKQLTMRVDDEVVTIPPR
jgi:hypothetical protein